MVEAICSRNPRMAIIDSETHFLLLLLLASACIVFFTEGDYFSVCVVVCSDVF